MKKLLLGLVLLFSMLSFGQSKIKIFYIHQTLNTNGLDITGEFNKHEVGFGFLVNRQDRVIYVIGSKKITSDFSIGAKLGQHLKDSNIDNKTIVDSETYYAIVSNLKLFDKSGLEISFGFDNTQNCIYGIGYKF
jgi:hypothetical protein